MRFHRKCVNFSKYTQMTNIPDLAYDYFSYDPVPMHIDITMWPMIQKRKAPCFIFQSPDTPALITAYDNWFSLLVANCQRFQRYK